MREIFLKFRHAINQQLQSDASSARMADRNGRVGRGDYPRMGRRTPVVSSPFPDAAVASPALIDLLQVVPLSAA